jgi:hypothetical protein
MEIKLGQVWQHYKGGTYEIVGIAVHSETLEEMVIYKMLYDSADYKKGTIWARPKLMWLEEVEWQGKKMKRFRLLSS